MPNHTMHEQSDAKQYVGSDSKGRHTPVSFSPPVAPHSPYTPSTHTATTCEHLVMATQPVGRQPASQSHHGSVAAALRSVYNTQWCPYHTSGATQTPLGRMLVSTARSALQYACLA